MLGCIFLGSGDWLMMYGNTAYHGQNYWLTPFLYWFYLQVSGRTVFPKWMAFTNVLVIYVVLQFVKSFLPDTPFRIGFTNGLMSESMIIWFGIMLVWGAIHLRDDNQGRNCQSLIRN